MSACTAGEAQKVSASEQHALPTDAYMLPWDVCADETAGPRKELPRLRARGRRQLAALIASYKKHPNALVRVSFVLAHPEPNEPRVQHEYQTVRELAGDHYETADPADDFDPRTRACLQRFKTKLGNLLDR